LAKLGTHYGIDTGYAHRGGIAASMDGFRKRGALGHLSLWGPMQVWPIWPFAWKA